MRSGKALTLMRHALAPGVGDPENFDIGVCSTQRNLSEKGREQAEDVGNLLRKNDINTAHFFQPMVSLPRNGKIA